jgi:hypothetical protein
MDINLDFTMTEEELVGRVKQIKEEADNLVLTDEMINILCEAMPAWVNDDDQAGIDYNSWQDAEPLEVAINMAAMCHLGQRDKNGRPYILHCLRVMMRGTTDDEKMVGVLHDVIEDTDMTARGLLEEGIPPYAVSAIVALSHDEANSEPRLQYYDRIKAHPLALAVKRYDLDDNTSPERMSKLDPKDMPRLINKYKEAYMYLYGETWEPNF